MKTHEDFIRHAYRLARMAQANGDHPFSALLVIDGEIVLECLNRVNTRGDATRHPELDILRAAAKKLAGASLERATMYASTEPCAMCSGAIYWSGLQRLVYGCPARMLGEIAGGSFVVECRELLATGEREIDIVGPVLRDEGADIHRNFW